jgi:multidrug efflux system membrane fusion protein
VKLRAEFANKDGTLFPNQFVNIALDLDLLKNRIIIPNSALHRGAPKGQLTDFVYVVNADDTVSVRAIGLGVADGDRVAVNSGLAVGERVVTEGGDRLRDGAKVDVNDGKPAGKPPVRTGAPDGSKRPAKRHPSSQ